MIKRLFAFLTAIFYLNANAQYTKLFDLSDSSGNNPQGSLIYDGTFLYGMNVAGGPSVYYGNIFRIKSDGTLFSMLYDLGTGLLGFNPYGSLISDGTFLYGMTSNYGPGGPTSAGTVFRIKPDGTQDSLLFPFMKGSGNTLPDGGIPFGSLISDGTFLYGMAHGGANDAGIIFKIRKDGTGDTLIYNFSGLDGGGPQGSLIYDGTYLYGMTETGGIYNTPNNGDGVIFKIKPDGTGYVKLLDFNNDTIHGIHPIGSLVFDGTYLYGMTPVGGLKNKGTIFKIKPDGTGYAKLLDFTGPNGDNPRGSLIMSGDFLYGMTSAGGANNMGGIFKINKEGCWYSKLLDFSGSADGANPYGDLLSDGTFLYGMTLAGGTNNLGVIFKINIPENININPITICQGQSFTVGSHTYNTTGVYMDTLTSQVGCGDSLVKTVLTVLSSSSSTSQTVAICSGQSLSVGTDLYTTSGTYTYTFHGSSCDSTLITDLTIMPSPTVSISGNTNICSGVTTTLTASGGGTYLWSNGSTDSSIIVSPSTDIVYYVISTIGSCVDTSKTAIFVSQQFPVAGFLPGVSMCCASHWYFSDTTHFVPLNPIVQWDWTFSGGSPATGSTHDVSVTLPGGTHTVCLTVTTAGGCKDSTCQVIFSMNENEIRESSSLFVFPNPAKENVTIELQKVEPNVILQITDMLGNIVVQKKVEDKKTTISTLELNDGVYNISLTNWKGSVNKRFAVVK